MSGGHSGFAQTETTDQAPTFFVQTRMRLLYSAALACALAGCSYKTVHFTVLDARTKVPVPDATLDPRGPVTQLTLLDLIRPQWTYRESPSSTTDPSGRAAVRIPLDVPYGVLKLEGRPVRDSASPWVEISKDGYKQHAVWHTINEWKALKAGSCPANAIVVELNRK